MLRIGLFALIAGCYHPDIADGTIFCSVDSARKCPSGFACGADGICYKNPPHIPYGDGRYGSPNLAGRSGLLVFNSATGEVKNGADVIVAAPARPFTLAQSGAPSVTVWSFQTLVIPSGMAIATAGQSRSPIVIAATQQLTLQGGVALDGAGGRNGGDNMAGGDTPDAQAGGGGGAIAPGSGGGGGGGYVVAGDPGLGGMPGAAGAAYGSSAKLLYFGSGGGGGSAADVNSVAGFGGSGGGAIALFSPNVDIEGQVSVGGLSGDDALKGDAGGGGGGAGGTILISGQSVTLGASANLNAMGGAGGALSGAGGKGGAGSKGRIHIAANTLTNNLAAGAATPDLDPADNAAIASFP
jgi:hypothetical protein